MKKTSIGGMALLEGIMMIGPEKKAVAVRKPDGGIDLSTEELKYNKKLRKVIFLRGVVGLFGQMAHGIRALMHAASFYDVEEEEENTSKFEKWLEKVFGDKLMDVAIYFSVVLALLFSVGLFILLPNFLVQFIETNSVIVNNLIEGVIRITIFFSYIMLTSRVKDIKRVWMYHGAEHKTINCYEDGKELTVENVRNYTTFNKRCGTSFMFIVVIVSILVFSLTPWYGAIINALIRLLLIPFVAGISYELLKFSGRSDGILSNLLSKPGMFLQKFTTSEPTDDMIEVAIAAFNEALPDEEGADKW